MGKLLGESYIVNLVADNPQLQWYVTNFEIGRSYPRDTSNFDVVGEQ